MKKLLFSLLCLVLLGIRPVMAQDCTAVATELEFWPPGLFEQPNPSVYALFKLSTPWSHIKYVFARLKKQVQEVELQELSHDAKSLKIQLVVHQWIFWDTLQLQIDFPESNTLRIRVLDNWVPTGLILDRLKSRLQTVVTILPITVNQEQDALEIVLKGDQIEFNHQQLHIKKPMFMAFVGEDGNLSISVSSSSFDTSPKEQIAAGSGVILKSTICGQPEKDLQNNLSASILLNLNEEFLKPLVLSGEKLSDRVQAATGDINIKSQGKLTLDPFSFTATGNLKLDFEKIEIENKSYQPVSSVPFNWSYTFPDQLDIYPDLPAPALVEPALRPNHLTLFADGPAYFDEIMKTIGNARESVEQEVFSLHEGVTTSALARLLVTRAIGFHDTPSGIQPDNTIPNGIRVSILHNHGLKAKGAEEVKQFFKRVSDEVFAKLPNLPMAEMEKLQERLRQNLRITALSDGPAWADHRKLLVIDGKIGYVGGRNWGDSYFTADSFQDQMVKVEGPTVRQMQQAFIDNWQALNPDDKTAWNLKSEAELTAGLPKDAALSQSAILTTSHKAWEIEAALLKTIAEAKKEMRIEHAYIYHEPIEAALRAAKARGVDIHMMFSERSDESVFERVNPATAIKLMQAPGKGKVDCWLYQDPGGKDDYMVHTKFLSVDGRIAIAGSANLIPRSLHSPFLAADSPLLFNEEIVIYIDDPVFVGRMDQEVFEKRLQNSRKAGIPELQALIDARGGTLRLLVEKLKGLLT